MRSAVNQTRQLDHTDTHAHVVRNDTRSTAGVPEYCIYWSAGVMCWLYAEMSSGEHRHSDDDKLYLSDRQRQIHRASSLYTHTDD